MQLHRVTRLSDRLRLPAFFALPVLSGVSSASFPSLPCLLLLLHPVAPSKGPPSKGHTVALSQGCAAHGCRKTFEKAGREILDATPGGKCTVFKKVDYEEHM